VVDLSNRWRRRTYYKLSELVVAKNNKYEIMGIKM
jgi:hypothetical protein